MGGGGGGGDSNLNVSKWEGGWGGGGDFMILEGRHHF